MLRRSDRAFQVLGDLARRDALEEAARVCETLACPGPEYAAAAVQCAVAIRNLKGERHGPVR
jgi:hypothetical protein